MKNTIWTLILILIVALASTSVLAADADGDGVDDSIDNCPSILNRDQ